MNKVTAALRSFMKGRYGPDHLGRDLMWIAVAIVFLSGIFRSQILRWLAIAMIVVMYYRMLSKNVTKRYQENRKYMNWRTPYTRKLAKFWKRCKDFPKYKYLHCPSCKTEMRVPRGRKNIVVTCPNCRHKFDAKS